MSATRQAEEICLRIMRDASRDPDVRTSAAHVAIVLEHARPDVLRLYDDLASKYLRRLDPASALCRVILEDACILSPGLIRSAATMLHALANDRMTDAQRAELRALTESQHG
jgi:hypothetical protein